MKCELLLNRKEELKGRLVAVTLAMSLCPLNSFATGKADVALVKEQVNGAADHISLLTREHTKLSTEVMQLKAKLPSQKTDLKTCDLHAAEILDSVCGDQLIIPLLKVKKLNFNKLPAPRFVKIYEALGENLRGAEVCRDILEQCSYVESHEKILKNQERLDLLKTELDEARRKKSVLDLELNKTVEACTDCKGAQKSSDEVMAKAMMGTAAINAFSNIAGSLIGMGLNIEAMKQYGSNYKAYLNNCMQVGVPCPAPVAMGGIGGMGAFGAPNLASTMPSLASTMPNLAPTMPSLAPTMPSLAPTMPSLAPTMPSLAPTVPSLAPTTTGESVVPSTPDGLGGHGVAAMPGGLGGRGVAKMPIGGSKSHAAGSLNHQAHLVSNSENSHSDVIAQQDISSDVLDSKESQPKASLESRFGEIRDGFKKLESRFGEIRDGFKTFAGIPYGGLGVSAGFEDSSELPFGGLGVSTSLPAGGALGNEHSK